MKKTTTILLFIGWIIPAAAWAVYAPIPEREQGRAWSLILDGGLHHDSNIFGLYEDEIDSWAVIVSPRLKFNSSLSEQAFLSAYYDLELLHYGERPEEETLYNHTLNGWLAYAFSENIHFDIADHLEFVDNPESTNIRGIGQTDQSFMQNTFQLKGRAGLSEKTRLTCKYRMILLEYDNSGLSRDLDRMEHLVGAEATYKVLPEMSLAGEIRFQDVEYDEDDYIHPATGRSISKNSQSMFYLVGADYDWGPKADLGLRFGLEDRDRGAQEGDSYFYGNASYIFHHWENSYFSAGATYAVAETDANSLFTDKETFKAVGNLLQDLTGNNILFGSVSLSYQHDALAGRRYANFKYEDIDENITRLGLSLIYRPVENLDLIASYDYDNISSDIDTREENRKRFGISARYAFGLY